MGPILLCDKSTLQGLSGAELNMLRRNYSLNIPPVLLMEILADLRKAEDIETGQAEVQRLANKLVPACSYVNVGFRDMVVGELYGHKIPGDGRPVLRGGKSVTSEGQTGMIFERVPEDEALLRWQRGSFLDAEKILATEWRRVSQGIDLEAMRYLLRDRYSQYTKPRSFPEIVTVVDDLLRSTSPRRLVSWFLQDCEIIPSKLEEPLRRIETNSGFDLETDLLYISRCLRVALIFHFGLAFGLVSTRPTNRIDLEYLYYVPLCMVFSSGDVLHRDLVEFISKDQIFIPRDIFKSDLKGLAMWWASLSPDEQEVERQFSGPPEFEASVTYQAWKKFMKPGYRVCERRTGCRLKLEVKRWSISQKSCKELCPQMVLPPRLMSAISLFANRMCVSMGRVSAVAIGYLRIAVGARSWRILSDKFAGRLASRSRAVWKVATCDTPAQTVVG